MLTYSRINGDATTFSAALPGPSTPSEALAVLQAFRKFVTAYVGNYNPELWPVLIEETTDYGSGVSAPVGDTGGYLSITRPYFTELKAAAAFGDAQFGVIIGTPTGIGDPGSRFEVWMGRAGELATQVDGIISKIQAKYPEAAVAPTKRSFMARIPKWAWLAGGATLLLGGGIVTALALRSRKGGAVGAWEEDYDDYNEEIEESPWERQVESFQQRHPQAPACRAEYDMAAALAQQLRKSATFYCADTAALTRAVEAAWEGDCFASRKLISKAKCGRNPAAAPGRMQRRGW